MFKEFFDWLFDSNLSTPVPKACLAYNSPITHTFVISLFLKHGALNCFLNKYFNNIGVRYLEKEDLFKFIKKCVIDCKVKRSSIPFFSKQRNTKLFEALRRKMPVLKNSDISLLCSFIEESPQKQSVYASLGLESPEKQETKKRESRVRVKDFIEKNFTFTRQ
jgi:hypothetical protein